MVKRIAAVGFIFFCTSIAWFILGTSIFIRTKQSDSSLRRRVASTWGTGQAQAAPTAFYIVDVPNTEVTVENGKRKSHITYQKQSHFLPLEATGADVAFNLEYRQKGLLWYSTYKVNFFGEYTFRNPSLAEQLATFQVPLPAKDAMYDGLVASVDGQPLALSTEETSVWGQARVPAGKSVVLKVAYASQGMQSWRYQLGDKVTQVRNFTLRMRTNFKGIDFPDNTLSPTEKRETRDGWELTWSYQNLVSGYQIGMEMPQKLQPGPLAGRISYFAPVSLLFFFFVIFILTTLRKIELHPMNYFFLACAFFAFHLLLAYLVDHISIHAAFIICSVVSMALVVSYLRLVAGIRFAAVEAGLAQLIYLILFSYAFFFEGFTGLTVTIGAILTLFVAMQLTGRIRWAEKFQKKPA